MIDIDWRSKSLHQRINDTVTKRAASRKPLPPTKVYYDPEHITLAEVEKSIRTLDVARKQPAQPRHKAKYRCLVSDCDLLLPGQRPKKVKILSGCMPNLFSQSAYVDRKVYLDASGKLKEAEYRKICETLLYNWFSILKSEGANNLAIPLLGGGVYLDALTERDKLIAQKIIVDSMNLAAAKAGFAKGQITLCLLPNEKDKKIASYARSQPSSFLQVDTKPNALFSRMAKGEATINPGSDRTIGGAYKRCARKGIEGPLEEQLARITTLVHQQACRPGDHLRSPQFNVIAHKFDSIPESAHAPSSTRVSAPAPAKEKSYAQPLNYSASLVNSAESLWRKTATKRVELTFDKREAGQAFQQALKSSGFAFSMKQEYVQKLKANRWKIEFSDKLWNTLYDKIPQNKALPGAFDTIKQRTRYNIKAPAVHIHSSKPCALSTAKQGFWHRSPHAMNEHPMNVTRRRLRSS